MKAIFCDLFTVGISVVNLTGASGATFFLFFVCYYNTKYKYTKKYIQNIYKYKNTTSSGSSIN